MIHTIIQPYEGHFLHCPVLSFPPRWQTIQALRRQHIQSVLHRVLNTYPPLSDRKQCMSSNTSHQRPDSDEGYGVLPPTNWRTQRCLSLTALSPTTSWFHHSDLLPQRHASLAIPGTIILGYIGTKHDVLCGCHLVISGRRRLSIVGPLLTKKSWRQGPTLLRSGQVLLCKGNA
jgi:hypothetical protein